MKKFIAFYFVTALISCSKKSIPSKTITTPIDTSTAKTGGNIYADSVTSKTDSANVASSLRVMVIADGYGKLVTPQQNLPADAPISYNSLELSKGFTTQQRANLQARYNTVLPRVLYVPQQYVLSSLKGNYYVYKKKFWYWKKADGLFYLDQKYYL
jgi:hypothetical protein